MLAYTAPAAGFAEVLPPDTGAPGPADPRRTLYRLLYLFWCWRSRFLIAFGTVLLLGTVSLFVLPLSYTAKALIMVGAREPDPLVVSQNARELRNRELDVDGTIELIRSPSSLRRVVHQLKLAQRPEYENSVANAKPSPFIRVRNLLGGDDRTVPGNDQEDVIVTDLDRHLKINRIGRSAIIQISFAAGNPKLATEIANAIARNMAVDDEVLADLTLTERAGFDLLKAWVVSPAIVPRLPSSPNFPLIILLTVVLGIGTGVAVILLSDFRASQKVLNAEQVRRQGVRALALIPDFGPVSEDRVPTTVSKQPQIFGDSIAALQASLLPLIPRTQAPCLVLLFASALPFEGKSTTIAALAASIAKGGGKVLVIDADLRAPAMHNVFGITCASGLGNCIDPDRDLDSLIQSDPVSGVFLLPAGRCRSRPVDILSSPRLHAAIDRWRRSFDFILIDVPPVLVVPDARLLVPLIDYCVFVARWGKTGWETVNQALVAMMEAGTRIAGIAVSRVDVKEMERYGFIEPMLYGYPYDRSPRAPIAESQP